MKSIVVAALLAAATVAVVWPEESGRRIAVKKPFDPDADKHGGAGGGTTILYHGGAVLNGMPAVYVIFYGNFDKASADAATIIENFLTDINKPVANNPFEVNTGYDNSSAGGGTYIQPTFSFTPDAFPGDLHGSLYYDDYSLGKGVSVSSSGVITILKNAFAKGLPASSNAVYFVLTSPDVAVQGFCRSFCAYHSNQSIMLSGAGVNIRYALVPDPTQRCSGCDGNVANFGDATTPNGDMGADEVTDAMIHELSESVTDPDGTAWFTNQSENGDLCNYNYGPNIGQAGSSQFKAPNGAHANFTGPVSGRPYLIQWIWKRAGGPCANNP